MSTLPAAKHGPVTAVDLTAKRKQIREEGYVPRSANGREWHFNTAGEASPWRALLRATATVPEPRVDTPILPIRVVGGEIARAVDETEEALAALHVPVLVRAGFLCQPIVDKRPAAKCRETEVSETEVTLLTAMNSHSMSYVLNIHKITFQKWNERAKGWRYIDPPNEVIQKLLAKGTWPRLPHVVGVVTVPTLRPDGTVLSEPGYDPATKLWYAPAGDLRLPPIRDTREAAEAALALFKELLSEFPFVTDLDRSVALAALMTPVLRGACDVVPLILIVATTPGSGKSYMADLASAIVRAQRCPVITAARGEEAEKRLGALILESVQIISIDNCIYDLGGAMLCQMVERPIIRTRILGKSETPECEWRGTLFANGNNIGVIGDMTRRTIECNLDPGVERPELRKHSFDPIERVMANRGAYVAAALTIALAYRASGERAACDPIASYGQWSRVVREPLIWLGEADPVRSMERARDMDPEQAAARELVAHWAACLGLDKQYTAREIVQRVCHDGTVLLKRPEFRELLLSQCGAGGQVDTRKFGQWLKRISGRLYDGHRIVLGRADKHDKVQRWTLTIAQDAGIAG
jgi:putative DNA primase/helicase